MQEEYIAKIQEHSGIIHKVIMLYIYDEEEKADVYQEILYQGWKSYTSFKGQSKFSTWLYKVALNTVLTMRRKEGRRLDKTGLSHDQFPAAPQERSEKAELLYRAISTLNEVDRAIITLHLDGYANEEVAEIMGITVNHTSVKLHRIKKNLSQKLQ